VEEPIELTFSNHDEFQLRIGTGFVDLPLDPSVNTSVRERFADQRENRLSCLHSILPTPSELPDEHDVRNTLVLLRWDIVFYLDIIPHSPHTAYMMQFVKTLAPYQSTTSQT
jgi:hypothetical protein